MALKKGSHLCATIPVPSSDIVFGDNWEPKTWGGLSNFYHKFYGFNIWSDGTNIYYSKCNTLGNDQFVLNGDNWEPKTWGGFNEINGQQVWTDGINIYYGSYVLNRDTDTWEPKTWSGLASPNGEYIWTDGEYLYYSISRQNVGTNYRLSGDTWSACTWSIDFNGLAVWSDGTDVYVHTVTSGAADGQYVKRNGWEPKVWNMMEESYGSSVWSDGTNVYYSSQGKQYVLNGDTWEPKTWKGIPDFYGSYIWSDGKNIYCSYENNHYALTKEAPAATLNPSAMLLGYQVGQAIRRMRGLKKPVAYLYNGVRLPALPETTYPYVVIRSVGGVYYLYFSKTMPYHSIRTNGNEYIMVGSGAEEDLLQYYYDGGELYTEWDFISKDNGVYFSPDALVWTNTDINKEDGTLYLAASEPVPVYA